MLQMQLQLLFLAYKVTTVAACSTLCSHETLVLGSKWWRCSKAVYRHDYRLSCKHAYVLLSTCCPAAADSCCWQHAWPWQIRYSRAHDGLLLQLDVTELMSPQMRQRAPPCPQSTSDPVMSDLMSVLTASVRQADRHRCVIPSWYSCCTGLLHAAHHC